MPAALAASVAAPGWERLTAPGALWLLAAAALLAAAGLALRRRARSKRTAAFANELGRVTFARPAVMHLARSACRQLPEARRPRVLINRHGGRLNVDVRFELERDAHPARVSEALQSRLRETLAEHAGINDLGSVNVTVSRLRRGGARFGGGGPAGEHRAAAGDEASRASPCHEAVSETRGAPSKRR